MVVGAQRAHLDAAGRLLLEVFRRRSGSVHAIGRLHVRIQRRRIGSEACGTVYFCQSGASNLLRLDEPTGLAEVDFAVEGPYTTNRIYTAADLLSFSGNLAASPSFSPRYVAGNQVAGSTVTLILTDVVPSPDQCPERGGTAHGTAHFGMIEALEEDAGTSSPGHLTLDATF